MNSSLRIPTRIIGNTANTIISNNSRSISAPVIPGTKICNSRLTSRLIRDSGIGEEFMVISESNIYNLGNHSKFSFKLPGGYAKFFDIDRTMRKALYREIDEEGGFKNNYGLFKNTIFPMGVKFVDGIGAVVFYSARLKSWPDPFENSNIFSDFTDETGNHIITLGYEKIERLADRSFEYSSNNEKPFLPPESIEMIVNNDLFSNSKRIRFKGKDLSKCYKSNSNMPTDINEGNLSISRSQKSNILTYAGIEKKVSDNRMDFCRVYWQPEKAHNIFPNYGQLVFETDLFMYNEIVTAKNDRRWKSDKMSFVSVNEIKKYVIQNFSNILNNMVSNYIVD